MAKDSYEVIVYKILAYYYACLKGGVNGNITKAKEITGCNDVYFDSVINELIRIGYLTGNTFKDMNGTIIHAELTVTFAGVEFVNNNSTMATVKSTLGAAFEAIIVVAVQATSLL